MKKLNQELICELNILKNRLESGESILQCLGSMGIPLQGTQTFLKEWAQLSKLMIEGQVLPAKAVAEFASKLESENRLIDLVNQKTLSPRIQSYLSVGVIFMLII